MPLRPLPFREVKRKLEAAGFAEVSSKGSHVKFAKVTEDGTYTAIVPQHREVPRRHTSQHTEAGRNQPRRV